MKLTNLLFRCFPFEPGTEEKSYECVEEVAGVASATAVGAQITLDLDFNALPASFESDFRADVAQVLGVQKAQVVVVTVAAGSVVVEFVVSPSDGGDAISAASLSAALSETSVQLAGAPVLALASVSAVEPQAPVLEPEPEPAEVPYDCDSPPSNCQPHFDSMTLNGG